MINGCISNQYLSLSDWQNKKAENQQRYIVVGWLFLVGRHEQTTLTSCLTKDIPNKLLHPSLAWWTDELTKVTYGSVGNTKAAASLKIPPLVWLLTHKSYTPRNPYKTFMKTVLINSCYCLHNIKKGPCESCNFQEVPVPCVFHILWSLVNFPPGGGIFQLGGATG